MTSEELCLSVDLGTGGPKVGIVTLDGERTVSRSTPRPDALR